MPDPMTRLETLHWMRDVLVSRLGSETFGSQSAAIAGRLQQVLAEIDELAPAEKKGTALDELDEKRRARGASSSRASESEGSRSRGR